MDIWKYFGIGHRDHVFCNPTNEAKVDDLVERLALPPAARMLDVACGKAELLVRAVRRYGCRAEGVDLSPWEVAAARRKIAAAGLEPTPEIFEGDGREHPIEPGSFDLTCCLGASWIWGGHRGTLEALSRGTRDGGLVVVGEPFWRSGPSPEHLEAAGLAADAWGTHAGNAKVGLELGLALLYAIVSSPDDWDRYEALQWQALERYAVEEPDDPDVPELLALHRRNRDQYLHFGRDEIGWGIYVFGKGHHP